MNKNYLQVFIITMGGDHTHLTHEQKMKRIRACAVKIKKNNIIIRAQQNTYGQTFWEKAKLDPKFDEIFDQNTKSSIHAFYKKHKEEIMERVKILKIADQKQTVQMKRMSHLEVKMFMNKERVVVRIKRLEALKDINKCMKQDNQADIEEKIHEANKVQKALKNIKGEYFESYFKDIMDDIKAKKCIKSEYFETYFKDIMEDIKVKSEGNA